MAKTKFIVPDDFNIKGYEFATTNALQEAIIPLKAKLSLGYHNWNAENKPTFTEMIQRIDGNKVLEYSTEDTPYTWVSEGTKGPYPITPRNPQNFLRFKQGGWKPKTTPKSIYSSAGKAGERWRKTKKVMHPGIEGRFFAQQILDDSGAGTWLAQITQKNIDRVA